MFNVSRSPETPKSLNNRKKYNGEDVYKALRAIFFDKCYLCETKEPQDINIEHFDAHQGNLDKKFDWNNLYFVCSRCNNIKGARYNNLLDCCNESVDVFRAIKLLPPRTPGANSVFITAINQDDKTVETKELLEQIFNNDNTRNKYISAVFLRKKIYRQSNMLLDQINTYYGETVLDNEKTEAIERMKKLIKRSQPYSAFLRWCILEDQELAPLLEPFMD